MSDILRYVTLDVGGRPSVVLELDDQVSMFLQRGTFTVTPPAKTQISSTADRRYGGSRPVGEITDNGSISWVALVKGASQDACVQLVEQLVAQAEANPLGLLVEWRPDGASRSVYYEPRGTMSWEPEYEWAQFSSSGSIGIKLSIPVAPLALWPRMDILDLFDVDTRSDYIYDSGAEGNEKAGAGALEAVLNVNTENRAIHTARGYKLGDNQQAQGGVPGATVTGWKNLVVLKRVAQATYIEVYVDDEGTHSRLRIDKIVEGARANLATTNLPARVANGVEHWVQGRIVKDTVTASYFTAVPTPGGAPTTTLSYSLKAGMERELFGHAAEGEPGRGWIPKTAGAKITEYSVEPFTYPTTLPETRPLYGTVPGDAPALADVTVTPKGGAAPPISAFLAWAQGKESEIGGDAPFGITLAESAEHVKGWATAFLEGALGGTALLDATSSAGEEYAAAFPVDPATMLPDDFTGEIVLEVWARAVLSSTIVSPNLVLSAQPQDGLSYGSKRYGEPWGSAGKLLVPPSAGSRVFRPTRLGVIRLLVDPLRPRIWQIFIEGSVGPGTSGEWGLDYIWFAPVAARCCSPSGKPHDASYPQFVSSTAETSKTIRSDLSARVSKPPAFGHPDHGLGGEQIELPPGPKLQLFAKLSSLVADDPTPSEASEQTVHTATLHVAITPRSHLLRPAS